MNFPSPPIADPHSTVSASPRLKLADAVLLVAALLLFLGVNGEAILMVMGQLENPLNYHEYGVPVQFYSAGDPIGGYGFLPLNFIFDLSIFLLPFCLFKIIANRRVKVPTMRG